MIDFRKQNGEEYRVDIHLPEHTQDGVLVSASDLTLVKQLNGRAEAEAVARWLKDQMAEPLSSVGDSSRTTCSPLCS